jgi:hypothetical protein
MVHLYRVVVVHLIVAGAAWWVKAAVGASAGAGLAGVYVGVVTGAVPVDLGLGRRFRPLGPLGPRTVQIAAGKDTVFDVLSEPYLGRQTRAVAEKIQVLQAGTDMVLAAHRTRVAFGLRAITTETVRFTRPDRVEFWLVRGPVPYVVEEFQLIAHEGGTRLVYTRAVGR